jgi:arylsulfatase A-like enzyme
MRARIGRLSLGAAMALMCAVWMLCGLLRATGAPQPLSRPAVLLPLAAALALLLPGLPRLDPPLSRFRQLATLAAGALLVLLPLRPRVPLPTVQAAPTAPAPSGGRSVVLIVADTLRSDHMSLYGYKRKTTPALDRRASAGLVFDDATAVAPWTLPSHASMFTGLWPRAHGAHAFRMPTDPPIHINPLAPEHVTLAEIAREHGYRTAGFSANNAYMTSRWGVNQGFEEYFCRKPRFAGVQLGMAHDLAWRWDNRRALTQDMPYFTAPEMTRAAIAWLERQQDRPFFLFLNYMDVHFPNAAPGTQGLPFEDEASLMGEKHEGFARYNRDGALSPAERRAFVNEYDRELSYLDRWLGVLLDHLESSGRGARTLVVLTSDHGEFLGEHDQVAHMKDLYNEVVNIPLIVWEPGAAPGRSSRAVQGLDLFPTILRYLGLPVPAAAQGQPLLEADHPIVSELYYAMLARFRGDERKRYDRILRTIRVGEHRYFLSSNGEERLFDLRGDPQEARNLIGALPGVAASGRARLEEWLRSTPEAPPQLPQEVDAETLENLRALGYIR